MNIRTDLALEGVSSAKVHEGISQTRRGKAFRITEICIKEDKYGEPIGKRKGRYITLEGEALSRYSDNYKEMTLEFANELKDFIPEGQILVVGLETRI